jgi:hypothetical protein
MKVPRIPVILLVGLIAGCASQSSTKPVEVLDERSAVTVGALKEPIELVPGPQNVVLILRRRTSFAYLGPVEWNRSGVLSYGLWIHIAPGNDRQPGDIHASSAVTVVLDDGTLDLTVIDAPKLGREPYQPVASWGQTAYFGLTAETLRRMAASSKLVLNVRTVDGSFMSFTPTLDARAVLTQYAKDRRITGD